MKQVVMTHDMRPYAKGDSYVLPDAIAKKLVADGHATDLGDFPPKASEPAPNGKPVLAPAPKIAHRRIKISRR